MSTHFFHYNNWEVKIEFDTSSDGTPNFDFSSDKESQVHIFMDREQLKELAYKIHEYLVITDIREKSLEKEFPYLPSCQYVPNEKSDYCANCGAPRLYHQNPSPPMSEEELREVGL